jgi:hypothetical protein
MFSDWLGYLGEELCTIYPMSFYGYVDPKSELLYIIVADPDDLCPGFSSDFSYVIIRLCSPTIAGQTLLVFMNKKVKNIDLYNIWKFPQPYNNV